MPEYNPHLIPVRTYLTVFVGLIILLALTIFVAFFDFGVFNKVIALIIAVTKASLITAFFMHLRYSNRLTWIFAGLGVFGFILMLLLAMGDYMARGGVIMSNPAPYFEPFLH